MKTCNKCFELKDESNFSVDRKTSDGLQRRCKSCHKKYKIVNKEEFYPKEKARYYKLKDSFYSVYLLVDDNYVGVTGCITKRFNWHKNIKHRNIDNSIILLKTKDKKLALDIEKLCHNIGFLGAKNPHPNKKY